MICKKAKRKMKEMRIKEEREVEESIKKAKEDSEIIDYLERGICPMCGSSILTSKMFSIGSLFLEIVTCGLIVYKYIHYECRECGFEKTIFEY